MNSLPHIGFSLLFFAVAVSLSAQQGAIDSLTRMMKTEQNDTMRYVQYDLLATAYLETKLDSSLYYAGKALEIARGLKLKLSEANTLGKIGYVQQNKGNYPESLKSFLSAIQIAEDAENEKSILPSKYLVLQEFAAATTAIFQKQVYLRNGVVDASAYRKRTMGFLHQFIGILYENANDYEKELYHLRKAKHYLELVSDTFALKELYYIVGRVYLLLHKTDSALLYEQKAYDFAIRTGTEKAGPLLTLGKYYVAIEKDQQATEYLRNALTECRSLEYIRGEIASSLLLSDIFRRQHKMDSSLYYANFALGLAEQMNSPDLLARTWSELAAFYTSTNQSDSTAKYQALIITMKDSLFNSKQAQLFHNIDFNEQQRQQEIANLKNAYRERLQKYGLITGLTGLFLIAIFLWRNNRNRQRAYALLKKQKQETDFQKSKVERALDDLKSMQAQLIQSEKMASLGELTAGIAHEIQNPLNFVNNFSEVNAELIEELKSQKSKVKSERDDELEIKLLNDIEQNLEKINHHGQRADAIVKGMLQHSRTGSGQKEPTDINSVCDEYLRLAYHGLRVKDKTLNVVVKTDFDTTLGKINIVRQDISRVILNLINNAFYAVNEKAREAKVGYAPTVTVTTKSIIPPSGGMRGALISVRDNGPGIPVNFRDKIFQPFFTTKPTGQGTGLGLSLAYDIVKAHGGEIRVETKEGEGSEFVIQLPAIQ